MTLRFVPGRRLSDTVIAEDRPFNIEGVALYRGIEVLGTRTRQVVVRKPHSFTESEEHFVDAFQSSIAQQLALAGTVAPQLQYVLGHPNELRGLAIVEEAVSGIPLERVLRGLRAAGRELPIEVALAIAAALVGLWRLPDERGHLVPIYLSPHGILITADGEVRAMPQLASDRARQVVGAMVMAIDPDIAYVSPEQAGGTCGRASGMFTLGLLLFELLATGHAIANIEDTPMMLTLTTLRRGELPSIETRRRVPPRVAAFVTRLLAPEPGARFEGWDELLVELDAVLGELPPCGAADILAALPEPPPAVVPAVALAELGAWQALPHEGLVPLSVALTPAPRLAGAGRPMLAQDFHYGADGRPMLAHGELLVDVRPVTQAELARFAFATGRAGFSVHATDEPAVYVSFEVATDYAAWAGKRLPSDLEWTHAVAALGAERLGVGEVWEWTTTSSEYGGRVVRGGRWRNLDQPAHPDNRSYERDPAADLGFRCVASFTG